MNITIILPAVHVTSKRQQRDESPQPTTPFPPISITPSPTPFSEMTSYNPEDYKDIIDEYNRELAENHLSKSRAEIVARQAAYDDIRISRSASSTPGTVISAGGAKSSSGSPQVPGKPCPYCSSDSKSEPSLKSIPVVKEAESGLVRGQSENGNHHPVLSSSSPPPINDVTRGATATSMSMDRGTESPSSVDTVNTVIQSRAHDVLGDLKQNGHTGSTLEDSFESLGNDLCQIDDLQEKEPPQQQPSQQQREQEEKWNEEDNTVIMNNEDVLIRSNDDLNQTVTTATVTTTSTIAKTETTTTHSVQEEKLVLSSSSPLEGGVGGGGDTRSLEFLYEQEEDELIFEDDLDPTKDLSLFAFDETIDEIVVKAEETLNEHEEKVDSPFEILSPSPSNLTPATKQEMNENTLIGRSSPTSPSSLSVEKSEKPPSPQQPQRSPSPKEKTEEEEIKIMLRQEQKVQQQQHEETALQKHEMHLKEKQQQKEEVEQVEEKQEEREEKSNAQEEKVENEKQENMEGTPDVPKDDVNKGEEDMNAKRNVDLEEPEKEKKVPMTEESGNDEVTIIVTQDDMPAANMFDSDDEDEDGEEPELAMANDPSTETETNYDESFLLQHAKSDNEPTSNDKGETETDIEYPLQEEEQTDTTLYHSSDTKSDYYEEEITKVIREDAMKSCQDSAYYDSHHEFNESFYNLEKVEENNFAEANEERGLEYEEHHSDKGYDYETSDKSDHFEKDFENESGYEDFEKSFHENSSHSYHSHVHYDNHHHHHHHPLNFRSHTIDEGKIIRQHTLADIPLLPVKKTPMTVKKQKTEDYTSSSHTVPLLLKKKPKPYPDPRKPAVYPQRLNKTTLARQALAREKRRIYVEERIQNFLRNTKSIQTPYGSLDRSFSIDRANHYHKLMNATSYSTSSKLANDAKRYEKLHMTSSMRQPSEYLTGYRKSKMESPQSLPDISIIDYYMSPSRGLLTSTPVTSTMGGGKMPSHHHKPHHSHNHHHHPLSSSMSSIRSPTIGIAEVSVVSGGGGGGGGRASGSTTGGISGGGGSTTSRSGIVIDSIPEETSDFWKAISSEEGYFYTFRVRQTGPVQMVDKAVQTQCGPMNFSKDFYTSLTSSRKRAPPLNSKSSTITLPLIDDRDKILREIAETVQLRHDAELRRAELIQRANDLQTLIKEKRDKINRRHEFWHKKYIEESSMTRPLEAACNSLRAELNTVHRRLLAHLEGRDLPLRLRDGPSKKANYKIMAARLQHEIKELQQKAKAAKLRLESEIKLKEQAEREVRELRNDLAHKKVIMSLARSQIAALPAVHPRGYDPLGY